MAVHVDSARIPFHGMLMSHMWADSRAELLAMADAIGVDRKWIQEPPKASWLHFDISASKRVLAVRYGAIEKDRLGPLEHFARHTRNAELLRRIAGLRAKKRNL